MPLDSNRQVLTVQDMPAVTLLAATMLADANIKIQGLMKAMAHIGCTCVVKSKLVEANEHDQFCRYRMKIEDLELAGATP